MRRQTTGPRLGGEHITSFSPSLDEKEQENLDRLRGHAERCRAPEAPTEGPPRPGLKPSPSLPCVHGATSCPALWLPTACPQPRLAATGLPACTRLRSPLTPFVWLLECPHPGHQPLCGYGHRVPLWVFCGHAHRVPLWVFSCSHADICKIGFLYEERVFTFVCFISVQWPVSDRCTAVWPPSQSPQRSHCPPDVLCIPLESARPHPVLTAVHLVSVPVLFGMSRYRHWSVAARSGAFPGAWRMGAAEQGPLCAWTAPRTGLWAPPYFSMNKPSTSVLHGFCVITACVTHLPRRRILGLVVNVCLTLQEVTEQLPSWPPWCVPQQGSRVPGDLHPWQRACDLSSKCSRCGRWTGCPTAVLRCISLMTNDVGRLFMSAFSIHKSSLLKHLFPFLSTKTTRSYVFLFLSCESSVRILAVSP